MDCEKFKMVVGDDIDLPIDNLKSIVLIVDMDNKTIEMEIPIRGMHDLQMLKDELSNALEGTGTLRIEISEANE